MWESGPGAALGMGAAPCQGLGTGQWRCRGCRRWVQRRDGRGPPLLNTGAQEKQEKTRSLVLLERVVHSGKPSEAAWSSSVRAGDRQPRASCKGEAFYSGNKEKPFYICEQERQDGRCTQRGLGRRAVSGEPHRRTTAGPTAQAGGTGGTHGRKTARGQSLRKTCRTLLRASCLLLWAGSRRHSPFGAPRPQAGVTHQTLGVVLCPHPPRNAAIYP